MEKKCRVLKKGYCDADLRELTQIKKQIIRGNLCKSALNLFMADFKDYILGLAFKIVPGIEYNKARRELIENAEIVPVIYEIVLPEMRRGRSSGTRIFH